MHRVAVLLVSPSPPAVSRSRGAVRQGRRRRPVPARPPTGGPPRRGSPCSDAANLAGLASSRLWWTADEVTLPVGSVQETVPQLPTLPLKVWLDDAGRPRRIRYPLRLPSVPPGGEREVETTYDYSGWGEPVDVTP